MLQPRKFLLYASLLGIGVFFASCQDKTEARNIAEVKKDIPVKEVDSTVIDTADYNVRMKAIINKDTTGRWDFKTPYPLPGAILPYKRVIAFYGNLFSKRMGVLGALPKNEMLALLKRETEQ